MKKLVFVSLTIITLMGNIIFFAPEKTTVPNTTLYAAGPVVIPIVLDHLYDGL